MKWQPHSEGYERHSQWEVDGCHVRIRSDQPADESRQEEQQGEDGATDPQVRARPQSPQFVPSGDHR